MAGTQTSNSPMPRLLLSVGCMEFAQIFWNIEYVTSQPKCSSTRPPKPSSNTFSSWHREKGKGSSCSLYGSRYSSTQWASCQCQCPVARNPAPRKRALSQLHLSSAALRPPLTPGNCMRLLLHLGEMHKLSFSWKYCIPEMREKYETFPFPFPFPSAMATIISPWSPKNFSSFSSVVVPYRNNTSFPFSGQTLAYSYFLKISSWSRGKDDFRECGIPYGKHSLCIVLRTGHALQIKSLMHRL